MSLVFTLYETQVTLIDHEDHKYLLRRYFDHPQKAANYVDSCPDCPENLLISSTQVVKHIFDKNGHREEIA